MRNCNTYLLTPTIFPDSRGYFSESFRQDRFEKEVGAKINFVQDNESKSKFGVLRGLHFQRPPFEQSKLVKVVVGSILDIAVDLRPISKTFGHYFSTILSEKDKKQVFIPKGFAHGFLTLSKTAIVQYKVDNYYAPQYDSGIKWDDKDLNINWQLQKNKISQPIVSEKDNQLQTFLEYKNSL